VCALSAVAHALMQGDESLDAWVEKIAPQAQLEPALVQRAAARVREQLEPAAG